MTLRPHAAESGPTLRTGVCFIDFELAGAHYRGCAAAAPLPHHPPPFRASRPAAAAVWSAQTTVSTRAWPRLGPRASAPQRQVRSRRP